VKLEVLLYDQTVDIAPYRFQPLLLCCGPLGSTAAAREDAVSPGAKTESATPGCWRICFPRTAGSGSAAHRADAVITASAVTARVFRIMIASSSSMT